MKKIKKQIMSLSLVLMLIFMNIIKVDAATVVTMRIFSIYDTGSMHSWLMFENMTSSTQTVGRYSLKAGDKVTVQIPLSRKGLRRKILGLNSNKGDTGMATFIISILLVIVIILVLRKMYRDKRSGKNSCGCGGSCAGCASAGICHQNTDRSDKSSGRKQK